MNHSDLCEVISIESLEAKDALIKQAIEEFFRGDEQDTEQQQWLKPQIEFAQTNKEELPEPEKIIIHLHFWEGLSISEISESMALPNQLVKNIMEEAIHRLRLNYLVEFSVRKPSRESDVKNIKRIKSMELVS